jgi:hypothetical protein
MPNPALKLPPTPDHGFAPRPSHEEVTALESLTDADERGIERQVLLRAAITDLKVMDVRLHHDRH